MKRTQKIQLLTALLTGTATAKQLADLQQSQEPIYLTLNLGTDERPIEQDPDEPTYCIDVYSDGMVKCYDRHINGQIDYRNNQL